MYPFPGGLLGGQSNALAVPGKSSRFSVIHVAHRRGETAYAGFRLATTGIFQIREGFSTYTDQANMWIHSSQWNTVNAALYECRFTSVGGDTPQLRTPGGLWSSAIDTTWYPISATREWFVSTTGSTFGASQAEVQGTIEVREIAAPTNVQSGTVRLTAVYEGLN